MPTERFPRFPATTLVLLLALVSSAFADTTAVQLNGRDYAIPIPEGFERVPAEGERFQRLLVDSLGTNGVLLAMLVSTEDASRLRSGKALSVERSLLVMSDRGRIKDLKTDDEFTRLKGIILKKQAEMAKAVGDAVHRSESRANDVVSREFNIDAGLKVGDSTVYPIHEQSSRHWSSTMSVVMEMTNELGNREKGTNTVTTTYLFFRPGVLQLAASYSNGDVAGTRKASKEWVEAVSAANPLPASSLAALPVSGRDSSENLVKEIDRQYDDARKSFGQLVGIAIAIALIIIIRRVIKSAKNRKATPPPLG